MKYQCIKCSSIFELKNTKECPRCGSEKIEQEKTASELLDEINDILDE